MLQQYNTVQYSTAQYSTESYAVLHELRFYCCATPTDCNRKSHFRRGFFANPAAYGTLNSLHFALYYRLVFRLLRRCRLEVLYRLRDARWFDDYHDMS